MQNCKKSLTCWKTEKPTQKSFNKNWTNYFPCYWGCCTRDLFRRMGCYIRDFLISGATAPYFLGDSFLSFFPSICSGINIADLHQFRKHTHIIVRKFHNQSPMLFYNSLAFLTFRGHTCLLIFICRLTMICGLGIRVIVASFVTLLLLTVRLLSKKQLAVLSSSVYSLPKGITSLLCHSIAMYGQ